MRASLDGPEIVSMMVPPVVMLVLIGVAVLLALRFRQRGSLTRLAGAPAINIVAARSLGWQSSLLIIEAEEQRFLVASGRAGVSVLGALGPSRMIGFDSVITKTNRPGIETR